jgi:sulfur-carrier protein
MPIHVKYFASLRERMGRAEETVDSARAANVAEVWAQVSEDQGLPANVLVAVNMEYADMQRPLRDGDEVAFFPPVTGG